MQKNRRKRDERFLDAVRDQACLICGNPIETEAHHPRMTAGMGQKADDDKALPLCGRHHRELHAYGNELEFWASYGINPQQR
jgi:hypothetical protein